jgi:maltose alpha-D-glucosyltransferase / alpha-amylase
MIGPFLDAAARLGRQTAELHRVLATGSTEPAFVPAPFTPFSQRALYQTMRGRIGRVMRALRQELDALPEPARSTGQAVLDLESVVFERARALLDHKIESAAIRCHGDFHLDQVLCAGDDFVFIDFEGEPHLPVGERQLKRSPLRDIAAMIRSFHYATEVALSQADARLESWARQWDFWVSEAFLASYLDAARGEGFIPDGREQVDVLLDAYLLERAVTELGHELATDPARTIVPMRGILRLVGATAYN